jgi:hypothetical protein
VLCRPSGLNIFLGDFLVNFSQLWFSFCTQLGHLYLVLSFVCCIGLLGSTHGS